jgi:hypothetical protein
MSLQSAREFLTRCFRSDDTIALLLRREAPAKVTQRIVSLETVLAFRYLKWLAYENASGMNIYVAANPLLPGSRKRTKESIAEVRHLYLDIDFDGDVRLMALRASAYVPTPTEILATSPGKYQVLWRVQGFNFEQQEAMLKQLAIAFGGGPACTDRNRVIRLPGFHNRKYVPAHTVTVEYPCDAVWSLSDFHLEIGALSPRPIVQATRPTKQTHSEQDWAWVLAELSSGQDPDESTRTLASRRSDKPNPLYYAQRTVDIASARLWLTEGTLIEDVIAELEDRRRSEIPVAFCSARAREIAATAQQMIHRNSLFIHHP